MVTALPDGPPENVGVNVPMPTNAAAGTELV
jgi:hypothetical protein